MKKKLFLRILFILLLFLNIAACKNKQEPFIPNSVMFLGHTYTSDTTIDNRLEQLNLNQYEYIWLGGDICAKSDNKYATLEYINEVFKVDQPGNYWALGNHDVSSGNYDWIEEITGKKEFYTQNHNGMTVMVLNTSLKAPECDRLQSQYTMFENVCDTIQNSSHLIILSHHVIWNHVSGMPDLWHRANANYPYWESRCISKSRFQHVLYSRLVEVQNRGVQVVFISGDYGQKDKFFQFQSKEGIWFLASGIDHSNRHFSDSLKEISKDRVLLLQHSPGNRTLNWKFLDLDSLIQE